MRISIFVLLFYYLAYSQDTTLYNFDDGVGQTWTGWTYSTDANGYGGKGFYYTSGPNCEFSNPSPQIFEKTDYGNSNDFTIDTTDRAPSTSNGGCLYVTEDGGTSHQCCTWVIKNCLPFGDASYPLTSTIDSTYDRLEFYTKNTGMSVLSRSGGPTDISATHHFGLYLCDGGDCPGEGPGNQHYYHYLVMSGGAWVKVQLNRHPEHLRGMAGGENPGDNPSYASYGMQYFPTLNRAYFEIRYGQTSETTMKIDEVIFAKTANMAEPNQNDESIGSMSIGYFSDRDEWELYFSDVGYPNGTGEGTFSTYEVRYSTSPITNSNYSSATVVNYVANSYGGTGYAGNANYMRKVEDYSEIAFTRFTLPDAIESGYTRIYFAIKDVSSNGNNAGTVWPYTRTDGRDAPNSYIRTIDYYLSSTQTQSQMQTGRTVDADSMWVK